MQIFHNIFTSTYPLLYLYLSSTYPLLAPSQTLWRKKAHRNCQAIGNSVSFTQINSLENFPTTHRLLNSY